MTSILILWAVGELVEIIPVKMRLSKLLKPFMTKRNENLFFTKIETNTEVNGFIENVEGSKDDDSGSDDTDVPRFKF